MRIERLEIWNLRAYSHADISFDDYTSFVGPNGAGKSTALCALNIFFRQTSDTGINLQALDAEDFHMGNTEEPIKIRVTFGDLSEDAEEDFKHYARGGKLIVTAEAKFDAGLNRAPVVHTGERLGFEKFRYFFERLGANAKADELNSIYAGLQSEYPDLEKANSKDAKAQALRDYEIARPESCVGIPSEDQFYGVSKGANRLERHIQWVYVPAVKDANAEQAESRNSAFSKLLSRAVNSKTAFEEKLAHLRAETRTKYAEILAGNQEALGEISRSLSARLAEWAHQGTNLRVEWQEDDEKSVRIDEPLARVKLAEGAFEGQIARLGHGLQRSFIIALLQELALFDKSDQAPRLILAIEEPELYQHPPQARHLALLLANLAGSGSQVMLTTHSPYFISGRVFENVRLIRCEKGQPATACSAKANEVSQEIGRCLGKAYDPPSASIARIQQALQPQVSEMFFATRLVFVEGREDVAFIQTYLELKGYWSKFRAVGSHIIPTDGKSEILRPLVIARKLNIPTFLVFDCDGNVDEKWREHHKRDNISLFRAMAMDESEPFPETVMNNDCFAWKNTLSDALKCSVPKETWEKCQNAVDLDFEHGGGLKKNVLHIAAFVEKLWDEGVRPDPLEKLSDSLLMFATP